MEIILNESMSVRATLRLIINNSAYIIQPTHLLICLSDISLPIISVLSVEKEKDDACLNNVANWRFYRGLLRIRARYTSVWNVMVSVVETNYDQKQLGQCTVNEL